MAVETLAPDITQESEGSQPSLIDSHGRVMRKLRVSLLDACNFRCFYCMPLQARFAAHKHYLPAAELGRICRILVAGGIQQIRVTGGEPTLRPDFAEVMQELGKLPLQKLGLTSNGFKLKAHLPLLQAIGCHHLNLSLDSLQAETFDQITRPGVEGSFDQVYDALLTAQSMGFNVKVNTVIMGGVNDAELMDFVRFAEHTGIEVRFLELMRIGQALPFQDQRFVSADQILAKIRQERELTALPGPADATAVSYHTAAGGRIGLIASESQPFCQNCSRLRLGFDGRLRPCLMMEEGTHLRDVPSAEILNVARQVMALKPFDRLPQISQNMYEIGG